jgi:hypothetical protein
MEKLDSDIREDPLKDLIDISDGYLIANSLTNLIMKETNLEAFIRENLFSHSIDYYL